MLLFQGHGVGVPPGLGFGQGFGLGVDVGFVVGVSVVVTVAEGFTVGGVPDGVDVPGEEITRVKKAARSAVTLHGGTPCEP